MHEVSGGRFRLGIGVAHGPSHIRMGVTPGKPLGDIRDFVEKFRAQEGLGELPPIIIAALRKKMVALAGEIAEGVVFANASRSHMAASLAALPAAKRNDPAFFIGNMIPTCISDDIEAAKAVNRRTLTNYGFLPNYRNYWKEAGYVEEMDGDRDAPSPKAARTTCRNTSPTNGWPTTRCSVRHRRCATASKPGAKPASAT